MQYETITQLLEKYWDGESSIAEERILKTYFSQDEIDPRLAAYKPLFMAIRAEQSLKLPADMEAKWSDKITTPHLKTRMNGWRLFGRLTAAATLLGIAGGIWMMQPGKPAQVATTVTLPDNSVYSPTPNSQTATLHTNTPKSKKSPAHRFRKTRQARKDREQAEALMALQEVKAALLLVSSKLNKGKKEASGKINALQNLELFHTPAPKSKEG